MEGNEAKQEGSVLEQQKEAEGEKDGGDGEAAMAIGDRKMELRLGFGMVWLREEGENPLERTVSPARPTHLKNTQHSTPPPLSPNYFSIS